jgi:hypothetical protein
MNTQFPDLIPAAAPVTYGDWPSSTHQAMNGGKSIIRHGFSEIGRGLSLTFQGLTEQEFLWIRNHYRGHRSGFDYFGFSTTTLPADQTPSGYVWKWAGEPRVVDRYDNVFDVACEFIAIPRNITRFRDVYWRSPASSLARGAGFAAGVIFRSPATRLSRDPDFSQVQLLIHGNGANNAQVFTDSSSYARAITVLGNTKTSTAQSVFGGSSIYFDGTTDRLAFPEVVIGAGQDACLDAWARPEDVSDVGIFGSAAHGDNWQAMGIINGRLNCYWGAVDLYGGAAGTIVANTAYWFRITRAGGILRLFINGSLVTTAGTVNNNLIRITNLGYSIYRGDYKGYLAEARITVGAARSTASYPLPTAPWPNS